MKPEFQRYLEEIGATQPVQDRVEYFYNLYRNIAFANLDDIFIDEYLGEDKSRKFTGLTFYSKYFIFAIPNFMTDSKCEISFHNKVQDRIVISLTNYDFKKTNENSSMTVQLFYEHKQAGFYRASQKNCEYLVKILRKYVQPSIRGSEVRTT